MSKLLISTALAAMLALSGAAFAQGSGGGSAGGSAGAGASGDSGSSGSPGGSPGNGSGGTSSMGSGGASGSATMGGSSASGGSSATLPSGVTAEQLVGKEVKNAQDETIGEIEDIVGTSGASQQAVVSVGGFLGMGDRKVAVPLSQLTVSGSGDNLQVTSNMTKDQLKEMPKYQEPKSGKGATGGGSTSPTTRQ